jgi:hypothetical protein
MSYHTQPITPPLVGDTDKEFIAITSEGLAEVLSFCIFKVLLIMLVLPVQGPQFE